VGADVRNLTAHYRRYIRPLAQAGFNATLRDWGEIWSSAFAWSWFNGKILPTTARPDRTGTVEPTPAIASRARPFLC
jgi:hypothetical protein